MKKRYLILIAIIAMALPIFAQPEETLSHRLQTLRNELQLDYQRMASTQSRISVNYDIQHRKMVNIMKKCNELSLRLYSQKQEYTLDLCFALEIVKREFEDFDKGRTPYDRIVSNLDIEIDRYARLIESLRRLPPEIKEVYNLPDSLAYRNDTLEQHIILNSDTRIDLAAEAKTMNDSVALLFVLDEKGERNRDTCLYFATNLLKMYAESRDLIITDSIHYREAYLRLKESYDYAQKYYKLLQRRIFVEGQTPWPVILSEPRRYWKEAKEDLLNKYGLTSFVDGKISDTMTLAVPKTAFDSLSLLPSTTDDSIATDTMAILPTVADNTATQQPDDSDMIYENNMLHFLLFFVIIYLTFGLLLCWLLATILLWPVFRFVKPLKNSITKVQRRYLNLLAGILLFVLFRSIGLMGIEGSDLFDKAVSLTNTFLWLLAAIITALLIRIDSDHLKDSIALYRPAIYLAILVIGFRAIFLPNLMMNILFPGLLSLFLVWHLIACIRYGKRVERSDRILGWISLSITFATQLLAVSGFIFAALLILIWWYFQLAVVHTMTTIWHLITLYKEKRMKRRINEYKERITYVSGSDKEALLFGATWFYDLIKEMVLPVLALMAVPFCIHLALDVFDFDDLYYSLYHEPFYQVVNSKGENTFRISFYSIIYLIGLMFVFRYFSKAIHVLWQQSRYSIFLRKNKRKSIRKNEINLSLGNSIISVLVWMTYIIIVFITLRIPTGSLGLVAGGFSAGVGLALKDIINITVYGVQLLTGRLKIGDWIECDGVRGTVTDINYQSTQIETINGTTVSFLNANLFAKSFTNLTKSNSYEFLKIKVSIAYGTDIQRTREVLEEAMQSLRTKDAYGREVVEPKKGIYVVLGEFGDSGVEIWVKQYVLAAERIGYIDRAKEVIYNTLNANGIIIPFPQRDIHIIKDEG